MNRGEWQLKGLCSSLPESELEAFFGETSADRASAKAVCADCPVRLTCLTEALERGETWGVWGGCDEVDLRRTLRVDTSGTGRDRAGSPAARPAGPAPSTCS